MTCEPAEWCVATPLPAPAELTIPAERSVDVDRHLLWNLLRRQDWSALSWPDLLRELIVLGRTDIPLARLAEGHIDALRIMRQAGTAAVPGCLYGVWASRSRGGGLAAVKEMDRFELSGSVPFASGAGLLDRSLVSAVIRPQAVPTGAAATEQVLLDVDVRDWLPDPGSWQTSAMAASRSFTVPIRARTAPAYNQVGPVDFYLGRREFFPGGIGVAAVWVGACARVADLLTDFVRTARTEPDQIARVQLGRLRLELCTAMAVLGQGSRLLADGVASEHSGWVNDQLQELATEVRAGVGAAARRLLTVARDLAGPAGLAHHPGLADAIADLDLYARQQHADRDAEYLAGHGR